MTGSDWTQAAVAFGTLAAVVVAIWGDWFRSKLAAPKLEVHLRDPEGELAKNADGKKVRFYHIDVSNTRKWAHAKGVNMRVHNAEYIAVPRGENAKGPYMKCAFRITGPDETYKGRYVYANLSMGDNGRYSVKRLLQVSSS